MGLCVVAVYNEKCGGTWTLSVRGREAVFFFSSGKECDFGWFLGRVQEECVMIWKAATSRLNASWLEWHDKTLPEFSYEFRGGARMSCIF